MTLWCASIPLGIPGEWTWDRTGIESDFIWNLGGAIVAASFFIAFIRRGWRRFERFSGRRLQGVEISAWLVGLVAMSFAWIWIVQEISPVRNRLGKAAFTLYYASSSGYFTRARYEDPDPVPFLQSYEALMREGDVLHTGTHPPGLFLVFHGLIAACESSPGLSQFLDETQPVSFREALDVIGANTLRRRVPRPLFPLDRRALWCATLLVMLSASLAVVPLYGVLRRTCSIQSAWFGAAIWSTLPAVAIFVPKSDVVFPLIGLMLLWTWLTAWDYRSIFLSLLTGLIAWLGLFCSLAFLPVMLLAGIMTTGASLIFPLKKTGFVPDDTTPRQTWFSRSFRPTVCVIAACIGFLLPTIAIWHYTHLNLFNVWWLNYRNHAGFYQQFQRTHWKWLLVNPLELAMSAGWPITYLAMTTCARVFRRSTVGDERRRRLVGIAVCSIVAVWGLLWLTGKNSGEAARLWILFLPWLIWLASIRMDDMAREYSIKGFDSRRFERQILVMLAIQFLVCILTATRVSGFHADSGNAG